MPHVPYRPARLSPEEGLARGLRFGDHLRTRRSVRDFSADPVPRALVEQAIRVAASAPSGANMQPWTWVAVSDPATKRRIREAAEAEERAFYGGRAPEAWLQALLPLGTTWQKPFLETAPWLVVLFARRSGADGRKHYYVTESCGIAAGFFLAALHEMGLCTLTHTPSPMRFLGTLLDRPAHEQALLLLPVGYPAPEAEVPDIERKPFGEVALFVEAPSPPAASSGPSVSTSGSAPK